MQQTDRTDTADTIDFAISIGVSTLGIDLRRILLALRSEIPKRKLLFSSSSRADVFIPTLREKFLLIPYKEYLVVKARKKIKIPMLMDGTMLSVKVIDVLVAWLENLKINDKVNIEL
jgi:hypothetical protein